MSILKRLSTAEVAVERPAQAGAIAHRPAYIVADMPHRRFKGQIERRGVVVARCVPDSEGPPVQPCAELSAGWADHIGAVPCPRPECFGSEA